MLGDGGGGDWWTVGLHLGDCQAVPFGEALMSVSLVFPIEASFP